MVERIETCRTCRFWDIENPYDADSDCWFAKCRRNPPVLCPEMEDYTTNLSEDDDDDFASLDPYRKAMFATSFPMPSQDDWCGEWQAVEQTVESLGLSVRARNRMKDFVPPIVTVSDLRSLTAAEILDCFGSYVLEEIRGRLAIKGLCLRGESLPTTDEVLAAIRAGEELAVRQRREISGDPG